jgi:hypothetical protein
MTITKQLDDLCQRHTKIPVVIEAGTQLPLYASGCFESPGLSGHAEEHFGSDGLKAVAPAQSVGDLHQTIQGLGKGIGYPVLEVVEDFWTPIVHGPDQLEEGVGCDRIKASLPCVRVAYGVANRVDRVKSVGNSVDPEVAEWIGRRIVNTELEVSI